MYWSNLTRASSTIGSASGHEICFPAITRQFRPQILPVVENTHHRKIISSLCLISQTWADDGIPFKTGRAELVATDPDYRRRGLVRKQFESFMHRVQLREN